MLDPECWQRAGGGRRNNGVERGRNEEQDSMARIIDTVCIVYIAPSIVHR